MLPPSLAMNSTPRPGFVTARSLIALRIDGVRGPISRISRHSHFPFSYFVILPLPDSIRHFPSAGRIMRGDLAGWGRVTLTALGFTLLLSRSPGKSSPRLSSFRDLRFLSDFPLEICIMYITARPFRKWETYLRILSPPRCAAGLTFLSRCFFPFRLLPRLRDFI